MRKHYNLDEAVNQQCLPKRGKQLFRATEKGEQRFYPSPEKGWKEMPGVTMAQVGLLEDNTRIAKLCATMLQYAGHRVIVYEHPRECLNALLSPSQTNDGRHLPPLPVMPSALPVDVLILDLHLPDITGLEVLHSLRSHPRTQSLPLIFCTAATPTEIAKALRIAPQASFVEKPFTFQDLISAIASALNPQSKASESG